jgi:hypothetical protein
MRCSSRSIAANQLSGSVPPSLGSLGDARALCVVSLPSASAKAVALVLAGAEVPTWTHPGGGRGTGECLRLWPSYSVVVGRRSPPSLPHAHSHTHLATPSPKLPPASPAPPPCRWRRVRFAGTCLPINCLALYLSRLQVSGTSQDCTLPLSWLCVGRTSFVHLVVREQPAEFFCVSIDAA